MRLRRLPSHPEELGPAPRVAPADGSARSFQVRRRVRHAIRSAPTLTGAEVGVASQNGEDGVLQEIFRRIGARDRYFVEFGVGEGEEGNCVLLADHYGWTGLFMEADPVACSRLDSKYHAVRRVLTREARVTAENIEQLLREAGVPPVFDLLSIDTDGNDFWIWEAIETFEPRVVVIEYNANLALDEPLVMPRDDTHEWDGTDYFGASLAAYGALAANKSYDLIHTERTGTNAFFITRGEAEAFAELGPPRTFEANYFRRGVRLPRDPKDRPFLELTTRRLVRPRRP